MGVTYNAAIALLVAVLCYEVFHFNIFQQWVQCLKETPNIESILTWSLGIALVCLVVLIVIKRNLSKQRASFSFSKKKSRSELESEILRETHSQVDALVNSQAYQQHRAQYKTTQDFIDARYANAEEEQNDNSIELSGSDDDEDGNDQQNHDEVNQQLNSENQN